MTLNNNVSYLCTKINNFLKGSNESDYVKDLDEIGSKLDKYASFTKNQKELKIMFGPSFGIYPPCFIHDRLLSYSFRLRGVQVFPVYCNGVQSVECNCYGGVWGGENFKNNCRNCVNKSLELWKDSPISPLAFAKYVNKDDIQLIDEMVGKLDNGQWLSYREEQFSLGQWAKDILVNNYVVGDYTLIPDYNSKGIIYLRNLMILKKAYERILDEVKPDRVISNDSFYGMWAILQELCKKRNIPFYSTWTGGRPNCWCYTYNDAAMNLDFSISWDNFSKIPLNETQTLKIKNWLNSRSSGKDMILDTASVSEHNNDDFNISNINPSKPTALLTSNVIWDLAALNKQIVFDDMIDWVAQTVKWFSEHPEFQLVIKPHPAEMNPLIPTTKERVEVGLSDRGIKIPDNVFLLTPKVKHTVYDFFPVAQVGLVHTTTVGLEMAAAGLPVITTAKSPYRGFGFTLDPSTKEEYFNTLYQVLSGVNFLNKKVQIDLAYKFIKFYHFHYYTKIDFMNIKWRETPELKVKALDELLPGKNNCLDYVVNSILLGIPILSVDRWPPESD